MAIVELDALARALAGVYLRAARDLAAAAAACARAGGRPDPGGCEGEARELPLAARRWHAELRLDLPCELTALTIAGARRLGLRLSASPRSACRLSLVVGARPSVDKRLDDRVFGSVALAPAQLHGRPRLADATVLLLSEVDARALADQLDPFAHLR